MAYNPHQCISACGHLIGNSIECLRDMVQMGMNESEALQSMAICKLCHRNTVLNHMSVTDVFTKSVNQQHYSKRLLLGKETNPLPFYGFEGMNFRLFNCKPQQKIGHVAPLMNLNNETKKKINHLKSILLTVDENDKNNESNERKSDIDMNFD
jgi:DNA-directed RNA polymerase subunit N (RpoN/RPB10)